MNKTFLAVIAVSLTLVSGIVYYFNKEETAERIVPETETAAPMDISFTASSLSEDKDGKRSWEMDAETIRVDAAAKKIYLKNLRGTVYRDDGSSLRLTAREGVMDTITKDIMLEGDIEATSSDGAILTAPQARFAGATRWFFATGGVMLKKDDTLITGDNLESDAGMEQIRVRGNAKIERGGKQ